MTEQTATKGRKLSSWAKLVLDFGPLLVFFLVTRQADLFAATAVFMGLILLTTGITYYVERRLSPMPIVTAVFVMVFGALTLALDSKLFIKIKPTIVNLLFAAILTAGLIGRRLLLKMLLDDAFKLRDEGWRLLTFMWIGWFIFLAGLNEVIWRTTSDEFWAGFKFFGNLPLTLVFGAAQVPILMRYQITKEDPAHTADDAVGQSLDASKDG